MRPGWILLSGLVCLLVWLLRNATGEMLKEEMQTRLCRIPNAVIRVAVLLLPEDSRPDLADEWLSELAFIVNGTEGLPVTRLLRGIRFAASLLWTARETAQALECDEGLTGYRGPTACVASGITYRQLDYWARSGLVEPSVRAVKDGRTQRLYGFRDVLILTVVKRLIYSGVSLVQVRAAIDHLRDYATGDLARVTLLSDGQRVYECTSKREAVKVLQSGEGVFGIALSTVWREVVGELAELPAVWADGGVIVAPGSRTIIRKPAA